MLKTEIKNALCVTHRVCGLLTRSALCCVCAYGHSPVRVPARRRSLHCNNNMFSWTDGELGLLFELSERADRLSA